METVKTKEKIMLINKLFHDARELYGGKEEEEIAVRYPDKRLYEQYLNFKHDLAGDLKLNELSITTLSIAAGANSANLGIGERKINAAYRQETDGTYALMTPSNKNYIIQAEGQFGIDTGDPEYYWVEMTGAAQIKFMVYPQPEATTAILLQGSGAPVEESVAFDEYDMLIGNVQSTLPEIFRSACVEYLLWMMFRSAEEIKTLRELQQENAYEKALVKAKRKWGVLVATPIWMKNRHVGAGPL